MPPARYVFKKKSLKLLIGALDRIGALLIRPKREKLHDKKDTILVVRLDHLGDVLLSTAAVSAIKKTLPRARLIVLTSSQGQALLKGNPHIDETLAYDAPWFLRSGSGESTLRWGGLVRAVRKLRVDIGLSLRGDLRENFLLWQAQIPRRIGYGITGGDFLLTDSIAYREKVHELDHLSDLLAAAGVATEGLRPEVFVQDSERRAVFDRFELEISKKYIGFQVEAGAPSKQWPQEHVERFLDSATCIFSDAVFLLLGKGSLRVAPRPGMIDLRNKTSVRELAALTSGLAAFVGPDSGPTHLAAWMGVPSVFLFSATNEFDRWKPLAPRVAVVRSEVPCAGCQLTQCNREGHPCMSRIEPEQVLSKLKEIALKGCP